MITLSRLATSEYAGYFSRYVALVDPGESMDAALEKSSIHLLSYYRQLPLAEVSKAYAPGKWTPKEVLQHLIDTERVMVYRALRFGRADATPLAGFEQDDYVTNSRANERSLEELVAEYRTVRESSRAYFNSLNEAEGKRSGKAGVNTLSTRAFAFLIAGHDRHHLAVLRERYWHDEV